MKFKVTAQAFKRETGLPAGFQRSEIVDSEKNIIFAGWVEGDGVVGVHNNYEAFWNDLNPNSEDVVFVSSVEPL